MNERVYDKKYVDGPALLEIELALKRKVALGPPGRPRRVS